MDAELTWESTVPAHFFVAEHYLDQQMERNGVRHVGFYAAIDVLVEEEGAQINIQSIEPNNMRFEVGYSPHITDILSVQRALKNHDYSEFNRTSWMGPGRVIMHYNTPQGKSFVDIRPKPFSQGRVLYEEEEEIYPHILVAESYLEQEILRHDIDNQSMFGFLQGMGAFCQPKKLFLRKLTNGSSRTADLTAHLSEQYIPEEVVYYLKELGFRPREVVQIQKDGTASTSYKLSDDSIASVYMTPEQEQ